LEHDCLRLRFKRIAIVNQQDRLVEGYDPKRRNPFTTGFDRSVEGCDPQNQKMYEGTLKFPEW
jgi:hypothetical protein